MKSLEKIFSMWQPYLGSVLCIVAARRGFAVQKKLLRCTLTTTTAVKKGAVCEAGPVAAATASG